MWVPTGLEVKMKKTAKYILGLILVAAMVIFVAPQLSTRAASAGEVDVVEIDYEQLTAKIIKNGNSIVYYSTDSKKTWIEVEGTTMTGAAAGYGGTGTSYILMDISWISATAQTTVYFKGDRDTKIITVKFPKQNTSFKATFNKVDGDFTFKNYDDATTFMWRKSTDYNWRTVALPDVGGNGNANLGIDAYQTFLKQIENMRVKGGKICIRTGQTTVTGNNAADPGSRPSKETTVSISKRASAPSAKLNVSKLTINTKDTMEYLSGNAWVSCDKNMELEDLAPEVFYNTTAKTKGSDALLQIRNAETDKKPYSNIKLISIAAQEAPPTIGDSSADMTWYRLNGKIIFKFNKATKTVPYEYCIIKAGADSDKMSWRAVKNNKEIKISEKSLPSGSTVYVRIKGVAESTSKGIPAKLPSAMAEFTVTYQ